MLAAGYVHAISNNICIYVLTYLFLFCVLQYARDVSMAKIVTWNVHIVRMALHVAPKMDPVGVQQDGLEQHANSVSLNTQGHGWQPFWVKGHNVGNFTYPLL